MKRYGIVIALCVAVVSGALAVWLANQWLTAKAGEERGTIQAPLAMTKVVVAARDLPIGTRLGQDAVALADWPKANLPQGAFDSVEALAGRVILSRIASGTPVLATELAAPGSGAGLVALIPPGKRAMAIRVDEVIGVGGFVLPNTRVDVIAVREEGRDQGRSETILRDIQVLAIAQETSVDEGKAKVVRTVTLGLEPKEAERLALEANLGTIHLVLRNPTEEEAPPPAPKVVKVVKPAPRPVLKPRVYRPQPAVF